MESFWQLGDELRGQSRASEDHKWSTVATKLAEQTRMKGERTNNLDLSKTYSDFRPTDKFSFQENNHLNFNTNLMHGNVYYNNMNDFKSGGNMKVNKYIGNVVANKEMSSNNNSNDNAVDKRFKTLPASETLPRDEVLGGYIFVCNNDTMQDDLKRHLFGNFFQHTSLSLCNLLPQCILFKRSLFRLSGLPPRYRDSVRAITPGLPLFLYNYTTHQLHGIFEVCLFSCFLFY